MASPVRAEAALEDAKALPVVAQGPRLPLSGFVVGAQRRVGDDQFGARTRKASATYRSLVIGLLEVAIEVGRDTRENESAANGSANASPWTSSASGSRCAG